MKNWPPRFIDINLRITQCGESCCGSSECASQIYPTFGHFPNDLSKLKVVFIGEAPGKPLKEELEWKNTINRETLVDVRKHYATALTMSKFGRWLHSIIQGTGLTWNECGFMNVVKCYPSSRDALRVLYVNCCAEKFYEQLEFLNPRIFVTLGAFALEKMTSGCYNKPGPLLYQEVVWQGNGGKARTIIPSFHPSYLFRQRKDVYLTLSNELITAIKSHI
jgi:uracil-DNA glycosylase family 4